ncbi:MAG TPA: DsrE/DsrF/DrsH-like family protein [Candidatus Hydrogenedentes bacterium]|nr:DsrE/DsrF/DrsH-like family protein [Candidatus Hydrogenedentota bacterium]HOS02490.1 DsrE/DsrF/DrsH-like family protein [Candidatus Hydrogenedentota bacterium]
MKHVIIVGGVAGGMSCAARLRRLDESLAITVLERGANVSFANCGMPYYIGGIIPNRANLIVAEADMLRRRFGIDIRTRHEVTRIDRASKQVEVRDLDADRTFMAPYDILVLSTGAEPLRPSIEGIDRPNFLTLNSLDDMDRIVQATATARRVCVIGAGFIGLELVENFRERGLDVVLVEMMSQVLPPLDWEMTQPLAQELCMQGVELRLEEQAVSIDAAGVTLRSGARIACDAVCLCAGVTPRSELARDAGLDLGPRGHVRTDANMRTSDPAIFAVGDCVETRDFVTGHPVAVPLAGPANRQGRIVADVIQGRDAAYRGTQGTAIVKVFHLAAAQTGLSEKRLNALNIPYRRVYVHPTQHPRYYPGAKPVSIKLLFTSEGALLGAQVVGSDGVDALIDVFATALRAKWSVYDLEHSELAYAPQWGGARHPVNIAGFAAANLLRGDVETIEPDAPPSGLQWIDVRTPEEAAAGHIPGAKLLPIDSLRERLGELPPGKPLGVYCAVGLRGYVACRMLRQHGFEAYNLNGGYRTWQWFQKSGVVPVQSPKPAASSIPAPAAAPCAEVDVRLDVRGLQCPGPLVKVSQAIERMRVNETLEVTASDPGFAADIPAWCASTGNELIDVSARDGAYVARLMKRGAIGKPGAAPSCAATTHPGKTIVCFSNDLDRVLAAFVIANGAAVMGGPVTIFFTFWGLNVLRKEIAPRTSKSLIDRMFGMMMPKGPARLKLSKMHMGGMGSAMMKRVMRAKNVMSLPDLIQSARAAGVRFVACSMSMDVMGIRREELIDGVEIGGVGHYLGAAGNSDINLFI